MAVSGNHVAHQCAACLLLVSRNPRKAASIGNALQAVNGRRPRVIAVSATAEALQAIERERPRAVMVEHHAGGGLSQHTVRALADRAHGLPVIWLIEDGDVIELSEAIAAGVSGAYYWDQLGPELLTTIDRLASGRVVKRRPLIT